MRAFFGAIWQAISFGFPIAIDPPPWVGYASMPAIIIASLILIPKKWKENMVSLRNVKFLGAREYGARISSAEVSMENVSVETNDKGAQVFDADKLTISGFDASSNDGSIGLEVDNCPSGKIDDVKVSGFQKGGKLTNSPDLHVGTFEAEAPPPPPAEPRKKLYQVLLPKNWKGPKSES